MEHLTIEELEAGMDNIRKAPPDGGVLEMIVRRPEIEEREVLEEGELSLSEGLEGDCWSRRKCSRTDDGAPHPNMQLNIMNARVVSLLARDRDRWQLAGDQLFIDMDLSKHNLPAGTKLALGSAVIEVTDQPHNGCKKFAARYGVEAVKFVNSPAGKELCMRGINAKVVTPGVIRVGDVAKKL